MLVKMKAELAGGHYHIGVWMGKHEGALGKCGTLVMREEEFIIFRRDVEVDPRGDLQIIIDEVENDKAAE